VANERAQVAVIIPARNAAATLKATLDGLAQQDFGEPFDVVVVDDASTDGTAEIARQHGARVVSGGGSGPAAARNAGAHETAAEFLAFTDADCIPEASWLSAGIEGLRAGADMVQGPIRPVRPPGAFDKTIDVTCPSILFESANLFVSRKTFEAVGGFERPAFLPDSIPHFGEDVLFGWRAVRSDARVAFCGEATVRHEVFPRGSRAYIAEKLRLRLFPPLVKEAPELRDSMPLGLFLSGATARANLALAGALLAACRRNPVFLLAALPYAHRELALPPPWRPEVARYNAVRIAADLTGLAALIHGSIRHRQPVL